MITSVADFFALLENFIYTMGLMPLVQGVFAALAIITIVIAISKMRQ